MHTDPTSSNNHEPQAEMQGDIPLAMPVENDDQLAEGFIPMALPVEVEDGASNVVMQGELNESSPTALPEVVATQNDSKLETVVILCKVCGSRREQDNNSCQDCGYYFTELDLAGAVLVADGVDTAVSSELVIAGRYKATKILREFAGVKIQAGVDIAASGGPVDVLIYSQADMGEQIETAKVVIPENDESDDFLPSFDDALLSGSGGIELTSEMPKLLVWPNLGWLRSTLDAADTVGLPNVLFGGIENSTNYLVL